VLKKSIGSKSIMNAVTGELEVYSDYSVLNGPILKITLPVASCDFVGLSHCIERAIRNAEAIAARAAISQCTDAVSSVRVGV